MSMKPGFVNIASTESHKMKVTGILNKYCAFMSFQDIPQMQPLQMGAMYDHINLDSYS
jgi:hypothetical protein